MNLRIAIIGAGLAGVSAGRLIADRGHEVRLLEKSRGCGGRCATTRWEGHIVDFGAEYSPCGILISPPPCSKPAARMPGSQAAPLR